MIEFKITDDFYLNNKPFKIISGALHYFRVVPEYWQDRLEKLKLLGCNTVETYVPWNLHEKREGEFNFSGGLDLRRFIKTAQDLGLYVILRPSPYICAEWEYGGFPAWIQNDGKVRLRFNDPKYLSKVKPYMHRLIEEVKDLQVTENGPILMMQVENEYGSFANDKAYLNQLVKIMKESGVTVPLFTSDGPWGDMLQNGAIPETALTTINCGSHIKENFEILRNFQSEKRPLMVMEFWIGWFDAWKDEKHHTTSVEEAANELRDCLKEGSVNIYMFHGGTNFGLMNGANYFENLAPIVTSYDYDALLTEWGDFTPKYQAFQKVISEFVTLPEFPLTAEIKKKSYGKVDVKEKVSLFSILEDISAPLLSSYPLSMEEINQGYGYVYYQSSIGRKRKIDDFRLIDCHDRAQVFINENLQFIQYDAEIGKKEAFELVEEENQLGILVENMGRINYSYRINRQEKGLSGDAIVNGASLSDWQIYPLPLEDVPQINFDKKWQEGTPAFYHLEFEVDEIGDTFVDLTGWGKGLCFVNGHHLGRFWEAGPQKRLYLPGPYLKLGKNQLIIFETEGKCPGSLQLTAEPDLG